MKSLFQSNWYTEVRRSDNGHLKAGTSYLDTYREAAAQLLIDINSFIIKDAIWEEQRSLKPISVNTRQVTPLLGSEAYYSSGTVLKEAAVFLNDPLAVALFSETIKGIIQTEPYLLEERGYSSIEEYQLMIVKFALDSCRFFSNLDRITQTSNDRIGKIIMDGNMFVRFKTQSLFDLGEGRYLMTGNFSDCFHEINVNLKLNDFIIEEANGGFLRAPDLVCRETEVLLDNLNGIDLRVLPKKEIAGILGKGQGCVHIIDLVHDCAQMLGYIKPLRHNNVSSFV